MFNHHYVGRFELEGTAEVILPLHSLLRPGERPQQVVVEQVVLGRPRTGKRKLINCGQILVQVVVGEDGPMSRRMQLCLPFEHTHPTELVRTGDRVKRGTASLRVEEACFERGTGLFRAGGSGYGAAGQVMDAVVVRVRFSLTQRVYRRKGSGARDGDD